MTIHSSLSDQFTYHNARSPLDQSHKLGHMYFKLRHRYMPTVVVSFDRSMGSLRLLQALVSTIRVRVGPSGKIGTSW
jgi:hypothetical protein